VIAIYASNREGGAVAVYRIEGAPDKFAEVWAAVGSVLLSLQLKREAVLISSCNIRRAGG